MTDKNKHTFTKEFFKSLFSVLFSCSIFLLFLYHYGNFQNGTQLEFQETCEQFKNGEITKDEDGRLFVSNKSLREMVAKNENYSHEKINTICVTSTAHLFSEKNVNYDISEWNLINVNDASFMFYYSTNFNQNINNWNVSNITNMAFIFSHAISFNQPLDKWDTSNVTSFQAAFENALSFNQPLNNWKVHKARNMFSMFENAINFNQPLDKWKPFLVYDMQYMFNGKSYKNEQKNKFNQDISNWNVSSVAECAYFSDKSNLSSENTPDFKRCNI